MASDDEEGRACAWLPNIYTQDVNSLSLPSDVIFPSRLSLRDRLSLIDAIAFSAAGMSELPAAALVLQCDTLEAM